MRTSTILVIFTVFLVGTVLFLTISRKQNASHPAMEQVNSFLKAIIDKNSVVVESALDPKYATVTWVGNGDSKTLVSLHFKSFSPMGGGAFTTIPESKWSNYDLRKLAIDTTASTNPDIDEDGKTASVKMTDGVKIFLRQNESGKWIICHIQKKVEGDQ
jgi:hypothetical protein